MPAVADHSGLAVGGKSLDQVKIQKLLKAYWSKIFEYPALKIHSLSRLAEKIGLDKEMTKEQLDFIDMLEPLNIEACYFTSSKNLTQSPQRSRVSEL